MIHCEEKIVVAGFLLAGRLFDEKNYHSCFFVWRVFRGRFAPAGQTRASQDFSPVAQPICRPKLAQKALLSSLFQFLFCLPDGLRCGDQRWNIDADHRAFARTALDVQMKIRAIQDVQPLADVAQPDAFDIHMGHFFL
jgi:hypothetical protein